MTGAQAVSPVSKCLYEGYPNNDDETFTITGKAATIAPDAPTHVSGIVKITLSRNLSKHSHLLSGYINIGGIVINTSGIYLHYGGDDDYDYPVLGTETLQVSGTITNRSIMYNLLINSNYYVTLAVDFSGLVFS